MLSTTGWLILCVCVAVLFSLFAFFYSLAVARWVYNNNAKSTSLRTLSKLEAEITELSDSVLSLHASLKKLRSRQGMRDLRARRANGSDAVPDWREDPDGYKRAMRLQLKLGALKGK